MKEKIRIRIWIGLGLITIAFLLGGCSNTNVESLPDADIIFQTGRKAEEILPYSIGFINSDGTGLVNLEIQDSYGMPSAPAKTSDDKYLIFYGSYSDDFYGRGLLHSITKQGELTEYDNVYGSRIAPIQNTHQVVAARTTGGRSEEAQEIFYSFDLNAETVIEENLYTTPKGVWAEIGTNALHGTNLLIARYSEQTGSEIVLFNLNTGEEKIIVANDTAKDTHTLISPAISPDGQWVAYTAEDGIYVVPIDGGEERQIVNTCTTCEHRLYNSEWADWPPVASWSSDSQWVVYHRCTLPCSECCESIEDYSIFKTNIQTGEEILLVEEGLNPYWRLNLSQ